MLLLFALLVPLHLTPHNLSLMAADTHSRLRPGAGRHRRGTSQPRHAAAKAVRR